MDHIIRHTYTKGPKWQVLVYTTNNNLNWNDMFSNANNDLKIEMTRSESPNNMTHSKCKHSESEAQCKQTWKGSIFMNIVVNY